MSYSETKFNSDLITVLKDIRDELKRSNDINEKICNVITQNIDTNNSLQLIERPEIKNKLDYEQISEQINKATSSSITVNDFKEFESLLLYYFFGININVSDLRKYIDVEKQKSIYYLDSTYICVIRYKDYLLCEFYYKLFNYISKDDEPIIELNITYLADKKVIELVK